MPCFHPLHGFYGPTGGWVKNHLRAVWPYKALVVPCGQCIGCRLERSRQWAIRCLHEAQMHSDNCFITLTYDDDHLPLDLSLHPPHFTKFMKRARKNLGKMRFFHCGEYGETTLRPHYHALIFGWRPDDPELFSTSGEIPLYISPTLTKTWGHGHCTFGELTFESAAYTARYCTKKITGPQAADHYTIIDPVTGEVFSRIPEYSTMSRRPGIGSSWLARYGNDTYSKDEVIMRARAMRPPRAYDKIFEVTDPETWLTIKSNREIAAEKKYGPRKNTRTIFEHLHEEDDCYVSETIVKSKLQKRKL